MRNYSGESALRLVFALFHLRFTLFVVLLSLYSRVEDYSYILYAAGAIARLSRASTRASRPSGLVSRLVVSRCLHQRRFRFPSCWYMRRWLCCASSFPSLPTSRIERIHSPACSSWYVASPIVDVLDAAFPGHARFHDHEVLIVMLRR